jgi:hypothetical protein
MMRSGKIERWVVSVGDNSMKVLYMYNWEIKRKKIRNNEKYFGH